jgi:hypothetical protein
MNNLHYQSQITFVWDKDFIESEFNVKFESENQFHDWISDKTVELIKESIQNKKIYWMIETNSIEFK